MRASTENKVRTCVYCSVGDLLYIATVFGTNVFVGTRYVCFVCTFCATMENDNNKVICLFKLCNFTCNEIVVGNSTRWLST